MVIYLWFSLHYLESIMKVRLTDVLIGFRLPPYHIPIKKSVNYFLKRSFIFLHNNTLSIIKYADNQS